MLPLFLGQLFSWLPASLFLPVWAFIQLYLIVVVIKIVAFVINLIKP